MIITSLKNPRVKSVVHLRDRRDRDREKKMVIEGYRGILRALDQRYPLDEIYFCPELYQGENEPALIERCVGAGAVPFQVASHVFEKMAYRDRPEGLLAVAPQVRKGLDELSLSELPFLLVAESIEKPGNLGTMLRSADATGVDGLILCDRRTDLFNPNVVRASTGTCFSVDVAEADAEHSLDWLREKGVKILAATPHTENDYTDVDLTQPVAVAVGAEQYGLSDTWMEKADLKVKIPMLGMADSLNVATAATILLYEVVRQRKAAGI